MLVEVELDTATIEWIRQQAEDWGIPTSEVLEMAVKKLAGKSAEAQARENLAKHGLSVSQEDLAEAVERVLARQAGHDVHATHMDHAKAMQLSLARREGQRAFDRSQRSPIEQAAAAARSKEVIRKLEAQERAASV